MPLPDILMVKVSVYMYIYIVSFIDTSSFCEYFFLHLVNFRVVFVFHCAPKAIEDVPNAPKEVPSEQALCGHQ